MTIITFRIWYGWKYHTHFYSNPFPTFDQNTNKYFIKPSDLVSKKLTMLVLDLTTYMSLTKKVQPFCTLWHLNCHWFQGINWGLWLVSSRSAVWLGHQITEMDCVPQRLRADHWSNGLCIPLASIRMCHMLAMTVKRHYFDISYSETCLERPPNGILLCLLELI